MNRRSFLRMLAATAVAAAAKRVRADSGTPAIQFGAQTNAWAIDPKDLNSFFGVLDQIRQVGYAGFETGYFNLINYFDSPQEAAHRIEATGLIFTGIHVAIPFNKTDPATLLPPASLYERVAQGGHALGAQRLIFSGAPAATPEDVDRKIEALNRAGKFAQSAGFGFAYHNHWWEFQSKVGEIDALYTRTDPSVVSFLLDAGHAYRGGADIPAFLRAHYQRIVALHLRDYKDRQQQVVLGQGTFPLAQVAATLRQLRWGGWAINEEEREDGSKGGLSRIEPAYKALREAFAA
jgi:inosose dehydratase